jgi:hypothetical protein
MTLSKVLVSEFSAHLSCESARKELKSGLLICHSLFSERQYLLEQYKKITKRKTTTKDEGIQTNE